MAGLVALSAAPASAQHEQHPVTAETERESPHAAGEHDGMEGPLGIPMTRYGSGTSWLPDATPMRALMTRASGWHLMAHENLFVGWDGFSSDRGDSRFVGVGWLMGMASHSVGPGEVTGRIMLSPEPATLGKRGYPLVAQSGETYNGRPLHDRQHPHDLFMELAIEGTVPIGSLFAVQLYVAPSGEPALGPTAFPHRTSAMSDPLAPLGHHAQDSTHIAFGVVTAGVMMRTVKLEGSWFNGREPDEGRWDFDLDVPDSVSGRLSWSPVRWLALQGSYGRLGNPERSDPEIAVHRVTASATLNDRIGTSGNWAVTAVFGENVPDTGPATWAALLEHDVDVDGHSIIFGRTELALKTAEDLVIPSVSGDERYLVGLFGLGYAYRFGPWAALQPGLGVRGTVCVLDAELEQVYGTRYPLGVIGFAQLTLAPDR